MTSKNYSDFGKSDVFSLSTVGESKPEQENNKEIRTMKLTDNYFYQCSQTVLDKFIDLTSNPSTMLSIPLKTFRSLSHPPPNLSSTSKKQVKLKGILKNSTKTNSHPNLNNDSGIYHHHESNVESGYTTNSDDLLSSNSSSIRRVSFNDNISVEEYEPAEPISNLINFLNPLQKAPFDLYFRKKTEANFTKEKSLDSLQIAHIDVGESSDSEWDDMD